ncbi:MAG: class I SAM-dependent methyltransferase [Gammaproteobacteria bacterium]|nr:MAG: class I SAM-dependent methyltransferase [Gammaproteobacteria bacterium]
MIPIVSEAIEEYARRHSTTNNEILRELAEYTGKHCEMPQMLTGEPEAALLKLLLVFSKAKNVLEIGMFTGYSALSMAEALPDDGHIISCDTNAETTTIAQQFFDRSDHGHKIETRLGPALDTIQSFANDTHFDLVFLDADKENYCNYYDAIWPLLPVGGLIVADNVLWSGRVLDPVEESDKAIVAFNDKVQKDNRVRNVLLTVRDGVMLVYKLSD